MKYFIINIFFAILFSALTGHAEAQSCAEEWQGKPLLSSIKVNSQVKHIKILQPDFKLSYVMNFDYEHLLSSPLPANTTDIINIKSANNNQLICVYPTYEYDLSAQNDLNVIREEIFNENSYLKALGSAMETWSSTLVTNQLQAMSMYQKIYIDTQLSDSDTSKLAWLAALHSSFTMLEYDNVRSLLLQKNTLKLPHHYAIAAQFIAARIALLDKNQILALQYLTELLESSSHNMMTLNQQVELELLRSDAYFSIGNIVAGEASLAVIKQKLLLFNPSAVISKQLLAGYYDNLGHFYLTQFYQAPELGNGMLQKGLDAEYQALEIAIKSGDTEKKIALFSNIAWMHKSAGKFNSAIRNYLNALYYLQNSPNSIYSIYLYRSLGATYLSVGSYVKALTYLTQARMRAVEQTPYLAAKIQCYIGYAQYQLAKLRHADSNLNECITKLRPLTQQNSHYNNDLVDALLQHYQVKLAMGDEDSASIMLQIENLLPLIQDNDVRAKTLYQLANFVVNQGEFQKANDFFEQAIKFSSQAADPTIRVYAAINAALFNLHYKPTFNSKYVDIALREIDKINYELDISELGPAWSNTINAFYSKLIGDALDKNDIELALNLYQRSRSSRSKENSLLNDSAINFEKLTKISTLASKLLTVEPQHEGIMALSVQRDLLKLTTGLTSHQEPDWQEIIWSKKHVNNLMAATKDRKPPLSIQQISSKLDFNMAVLAYFQTDNHVFVFVIKKSGINLHKVGSIDNVSQHADDLVHIMSSPNSPIFKNPISQQTTFIPKELIGEGIEHLIIVPHDKLNRIPFAALPLNQLSQSYIPLIERFRVSIVAAIDDWQITKTAASNQEHKQVVVFANPDTKSPSINIDETNWTRALPDLPWAEEEARQLVLLYPSTHVFTGNRANRFNLLQQDVRQSDILHIATHSYFNQNFPDNVGFTLSLSNEDGIPDPGFVTVSELLTYPFDNWLVFINGCESALGAIAVGAGLQGIPRHFLASGARNVVATLWPVSDRASSLFTQIFYAHLVKKNSIASSLQEAGLTVRKNPRYRHPFYWAAYTLYTTEPLG